MEISTVLCIVFAAMAIALAITPGVARWASRKGICDLPSSRRIHLDCIPRAGGIALLCSFLPTYSVALGLAADEGFAILLHPDQLVFFGGALAIFTLGLFDDVRSLPPWLKFSCQIIIGLVVWLGGFGVELLSVSLHTGVSLPGWLSLLITVFWVVLLINAMNLIDGLDGLAAGICLFASLTLLMLCFAAGTPMLVIGFAALAGSCLGFLRYNFNPASIFMGDCGSYLLGYLLAVFTIQGAMKSHAAVAILIPIIALGVPLVDTLIAPLRRFVLGKKMFGPDQSHVHHLLIKVGYSHRRAVMIIYAATVILGLVALAFVYVKDQWSAYVLAIPGALFFVAVRKLGYLEYIAADKIWGWFRDLTDEAGFSNERRSFLNVQMQILRSQDFDELWENVCVAIAKLDFDMAEVNYYRKPETPGPDEVREWRRDAGVPLDLSSSCQFKLEMPLMADQHRVYGALWLVKDLQRSNMSHYTLRRVEHLRRTIIGVLDRLDRS